MEPSPLQGCEPLLGQPSFWKEVGGCHCFFVLPGWPPRMSNVWGHCNWAPQEIPLVTVASDIWSPNYNLHLPSDSQFSIYATVISSNPLCFLLGCEGHVHLIDGETDEKRQVNCPRSPRAKTWSQVLLTPSPIHQGFSNFTPWSPQMLGAGEGKGLKTWRRRPRGRGSVLFSSLHCRLHLYQDSVSDLFERLVLLSKCFQRTIPNCSFFSGNWVQALPSLGLSFLYSSKKKPTFCWRIYSTPRWQHKGGENVLHRDVADPGLSPRLVWLGKLFTSVSPSVKMRGLA